MNITSKELGLKFKYPVNHIQNNFYNCDNFYFINRVMFVQTVASMFQNLQNLANMQQNMPPMSQQLQQQMSQQMSQLAANLQGLTSMPSNPVINSPLNLSVSAPGKIIFCFFYLSIHSKRYHKEDKKVF